MMKEIIAMMLASASLVSTQQIPIPETIPMHATAYVLTGTTASGEQTRQGICASGHPEWLGKTVIMYQRTDEGFGELIGVYEVLDTGCANTVIDVWCDGMDEAQAFMNRVYEDECAGKIYVQLLDR